MSIKVLIVDDERLERVLIKMSYQWEDNGFEVVGEAASGLEAMRLVKMFNPDIIFTDINMPFTNGIDFTAWLNNQAPHTKVIMITGYEKFEYAQKAVQLGVKDFLLKPIKKQDIENILAICKEEILKEKENELVLNHLKKAQEIVCHNTLERLIENSLVIEEEAHHLKEFNLEFLSKGALCINIKIDDESKNDQVLALLNSCPHDASTYVAFKHYSGNLICLLTGDEMHQYINTAELILRTHLRNEFLMSVGTYCGGVNGVAKSYRQTVRAMTEAMYENRKEVIYFEDVIEHSGEYKDQVNFKELMFFLENGLTEKVEMFIDDYMSSLIRKNILEIDMIKLVLMNIVSIYSVVLNDKGYNLGDVFESEQLFYERVSKSNSLHEMSLFLKESARKLMAFQAQGQDKPSNKLVDIAKDYIDTNLCDSSLSLKTMAAYLYVNESYLSRTFKKEIGMSVIEYITQNRIQKSIEFLNNTDLKAYEIAEKIGINDPHYFGICFKKYTGKTIKQYKSQMIS